MATATTNTIATLLGTGLKPGVSANRRLYTEDHITRAVARAQQRLESGGRPLTMRTHHPEPGQSAHVPVTETVGRLTAIWQDADGRLRWRGALAGTDEGRNVLTLVDNRDGQQPYIKNVSIRGSWIGPTRRVRLSDGSWGETADDLEIDGIDFTHKPGVEGAEIEQVFGPGGGATETGPDGRTVIYESAPEVQVTEISEATEAPKRAGGPFADPGYQSDKKPRYDLGTKKKAKAAWAYINQPDNARLYSGAQLKRIKARIVKALKGYNVEVAKQGVGEAAWMIEVQPITEGLAETYGYEARPGSFSVSLDNGMVCVSVYSYCVNDPHDLDALGRAAMDGACKALAAMDPDMDGDVDVPGAPAEDRDGDAGRMGYEAATEAATKSGTKLDADGDTDGDDDKPATEAATEAATETAPAGADVPVTESTAPTADAAPTTESEGSAMAETTEAAPVTEAANTTAPATQAAQAAPALTPEMFSQLATSVIEAYEGVRAKKKAAKKAALAEAALTEAATKAAAGQTPVTETAPATPAAPAAPAAGQQVTETAAAAAAVTESETDRINRLAEERFRARVQEAVKSGEIQVGRRGLVGRVTESAEGGVSTVTPLGSGDVELNEHGLPRSWAGDRAAHQLKGAERSHLAAVLTQHVLGNRLPA